MSDKKIRIYNKWGNPVTMQEEVTKHSHTSSKLDEQIATAKVLGAKEDVTPHGMTHNEVTNFHVRAEKKLKSEGIGSVYSKIGIRNKLLQENLPEGAILEKRRGQMIPGGGGGGINGPGNNSSVFTSATPYQPEFSDPSRQSFPVYRRIANTYMRLFYKLDPVIHSVIEMMSMLPFSDFQLTGEGVDGTIKEALEHMIRETKLHTILPQLVSEWLVIGEAIPHCFFNNEKGIWDHVAIHNPDQVNVVYSPFIKMDPILEFVPDSKLREIASSNHPMLSRVRKTMPPELVSRLRAGENVPLSPVNSTFIAKKLHPYDLRGTSIIASLWRILEVEDHLFNTFIQTAKRCSQPLKLIKLGDPTTGVLPGPEEEQRILQLLAQAEQDPAAWMVYNYRISSELIGDPGRILSINTHYDLIERIKLVALGVSKAFISGESSYSSSAAGLTIFLQKLKSFRDMFVNEWLIPKYFLPVAIINEWIKPSKAQASGGHVRVKKSSQELFDERKFIIPKLEWAKSLDPQIDRDMIDAAVALEQNLGIKITDQKKFSMVGLNSEEQQKQLIEEYKFKKDLAGNDPVLAEMLKLPVVGGGSEEGGPGGGGGGGMTTLPGIPPEAMGVPGGGEGGEGGSPGEGGEPPPLNLDTGTGGGGGEEAPPAPEGASIKADADKDSKNAKPAYKKLNDPANKNKSENSSSKREHIRGKREPKHWAEQTLTPIKNLFESFDVRDVLDDDAEPWIHALKDKNVKSAIKSNNSDKLWEAIEFWLLDEGYPADAINELGGILTAPGHVTKSSRVSDKELELYASQLGINLGNLSGKRQI